MKYTKRRHNKRKGTMKRFRGGSSNGAADFAAKVYNGMDQVRSTEYGTHGNAIHMNYVPNCSSSSMNPAPVMGGGKRRKKHGGVTLSTLAVPAALLYANQRYSRKNPYDVVRSRSIKKHRR